MIRLATEHDIKKIGKIARQHRAELGFVMNVALMEAIKTNSLNVFEKDGIVVGFVHYHPRRDGWKTIHEIAVERTAIREGLGQQLFDSVPKPIRLKTTVENVGANKFYLRNGMKLVRIEAGKKRELNVYELEAH